LACRCSNAIVPSRGKPSCLREKRYLDSTVLVLLQYACPLSIKLGRIYCRRATGRRRAAAHKVRERRICEPYLTQTRAWAELVPLLQAALQTLAKQVPAAGSWAILFELPLYRLQRRIDIIARCLRRCPLFCVPCACHNTLVQTGKYAGRAGLAGTSGRAPKSEWSGIGPHAPLWGPLAPGHVVPFQRWNFKATLLHCKSDSATLCSSARYYFGTESAVRQVRNASGLSRNGGCPPSTAISGFAQSLAPNKLSSYCDSQQLTCASNVDLLFRPLPETAFGVIR